MFKFNLSIQHNLPFIEIDKTAQINSSDLVLILFFLSNGGFLVKFQDLLKEKLSPEDYEFLLQNLASLDATVNKMTAEIELAELMTPVIGNQMLPNEDLNNDGSIQ